MNASKGCAAALIAVIAIVGAVTVGVGSADGIGSWFIQGTLDRMNPLAIQVTAYARVPAPDDYVDSYADAAGGGENYVYEVRAYDEGGLERKASLISFGGVLDGGAGSYLKLSVKGSYVRHWEYVAADDIPDAARALG